MKNKIDPYGIPNVNFTLINEDDERWEEFKQERLERGFDESELWNLDYTIAKFIYPRLQAFFEGNISHPIGMTQDEWYIKIKSMLDAFKLIITDKGPFNEEEDKIINEGLDNFRKYFFWLWI